MAAGHDVGRRDSLVGGRPSGRGQVGLEVRTAFVEGFLAERYWPGGGVTLLPAGAPSAATGLRMDRPLGRSRPGEGSAATPAGRVPCGANVYASRIRNRQASGR